MLFAGSKTAAGTGPADVTWVRPFAWSPDGKSILAGLGTFVSAGVVSGSRLVTMSVADGTVTTLKDLGRTFPDNASFSPDGRFIMYDYAPEDHDRRDVFIMAADGSSHAPLIDYGGSHDTALAWVDPGRVLYVSDRSGSRDVWLLRVNRGKRVGESVVVRRSVGDALRSLGVTRDGSILTERVLQLSDVLTAAIDPVTGRATGEPGPLVRAQSGVTRGQATWAPDGSRIAYFQTARASGRARTLAVHDLRTGGVRSYPLTTENPERLVWRPDGKAIVFNGAAEGASGGESLYLVDLETGAVTPIARAIQAAFSPDGRYLYYPRQGELFRRDLTSGSEDVIHRGQGARDARTNELRAEFVSGVSHELKTPITLDANRFERG